METVIEREERVTRARSGLETQPDGTVLVVDVDAAADYIQQQVDLAQSGTHASHLVTETERCCC